MRKILLSLIVASSIACVTGDVVGSKTVNGTYTLRTVNDQSLPYTVSTDATTKTEILDDTFILYEGFTYAEAWHMRTTVNGTPTTTTFNTTGSFGLVGNSITFRDNATPGVQVVAVGEANTITIVNLGLTKVFRK